MFTQDSDRCGNRGLMPLGFSCCEPHSLVHPLPILRFYTSYTPTSPVLAQPWGEADLVGSILHLFSP